MMIDHDSPLWPRAWAAHRCYGWRGEVHLRPAGIERMAEGSLGLTPAQLTALAELENSLDVSESRASD
ncbi:hypothetical protein [Pseudonocardia xishanensis]|uniref:Uncharacterized protein n=1 Tax=Pseudonocardia xishanensis TaxID=630995 RepID=A0ABP8RRR4_9PSEU